MLNFYRIIKSLFSFCISLFGVIKNSFIVLAYSIYYGTTVCNGMDLDALFS